MINATNHERWAIQMLTKEGWDTLGDSKDIFTRDVVVKEVENLRIMFPNREWRVYEVVK
jgi:hypothetical protein